MASGPKVLSVYEGFFTGGARILHTDVVQGLHASGQDHAVLSIHNETARENTVQMMENDACYQRLTASGIAVSSLQRRSFGGVRWPFFTGEELDAYDRLATESDVVLTLKEQPLRLTRRSRVRRPVITCLHRTDPENQGGALRDLRIGIETGRVATAICCANATKVAYEAAGVPGEKLQVVANGIDLERFRESPEQRQQIRNELGIDAQSPVITLAARFDTMKNIPLFLEAANIYLQKTAAAHVVLCGAGMTDENPHFMRLVDDTCRDVPHLEERFHPLGIRRDMPAVYAASDIVSLTSSFGEAYPLCLIEGMACGAVPVATDIGDCRDIVHGRGLITGSDPESVARAWDTAYADKEYYRQEITRTRYQFGRERMLDEYRGIIESYVPVQRTREYV